MSDANKAVVREYYRLLDAGDIDGIMGVIHDDLSWTMHGVGDLTRESIGPLAQGFAAAFPDMKHTISDQSAEGNTVTTPLTFMGTHNGDLMGIPASGKSVEIRGINVHEVVDGKIKGGETIIDLMGLMQQIGAVPGPGG
ncbi:MAG: ester cyclase [Chloroflexi bacterium]|nr:ester cyclase [Chloroflexota bacterium]